MIKKLSAGDQGVPDGEGGEMSFLDHLEELRWHILRSLVGILIFAVIVFIFQDWVFKNIIFAHTDPDFITYKIFSKIGLDLSPADFKIITVEMAESFFTALRVAFWMGLVISFPYVFYQFWSFVKPGLYAHEQDAARGVVFVCSFLFLTGVLFGFVVLAPFAIRFLMGYSVGIQVSNEVSLSSYVKYLTNFTVPTGIVFQLPLLMYFLGKVGLITAEFLRTYRKHSVVAIMVLAAIITPPDPMTMFLIGTPLLGLYEISIFITARAERKRAKEVEE